MPSRTTDPLDFAPYEGLLLRLPFVRRVRPRVPKASGDRNYDLELEVELSDGSERRLFVRRMSSHLTRSSAHHLRAGLGDEPERWLVAAPYVGGPLGDALEAEGVQFIDQAGNCYLRLDDHFVARIQGRSAGKPPARSKELRSAGYQVLFALLAEPALVRATQREIADAAGTSRQPVIDLLARLVEERVLVRNRRRHEWGGGRDAALLDRWVAGYRSHVRPKLYVGRYRLPAQTPDELEASLEEHLDSVRHGAIRYGGTAGAYRLVRHYRGPDTVAHLGEPDHERLRALRATPTRTERPGDLVWMRSFGTATLDGETPDTVHPLLIYSELVSDPDPRAAESARLVRERYLEWSL